MNHVVFSLILIFADGTNGGREQAAQFKTMAECQRAIPSFVLAVSHPASGVCIKTEQSRVNRAPPVYYPIPTGPES